MSCLKSNPKLHGSHSFFGVFLEDSNCHNNKLDNKLLEITSWCADLYPFRYKLCVQEWVCELEKIRALTCRLKFLVSKLGFDCPLKPFGQFNPKMCPTESGILTANSLQML